MLGLRGGDGFAGGQSNIKHDNVFTFLIDAFLSTMHYAALEAFMKDDKHSTNIHIVPTKVM